MLPKRGRLSQLPKARFPYGHVKAITTGKFARHLDRLDLGIGDYELIPFESIPGAIREIFLKAARRSAVTRGPDVIAVTRLPVSQYTNHLWPQGEPAVFCEWHLTAQEAAMRDGKERRTLEVWRIHTDSP